MCIIKESVCIRTLNYCIIYKPVGYLPASYVEGFLENAGIIVPNQNYLPFESRYAFSTSCVFWLISNDVINLSFSEIKLFLLDIP